MIAALYTWRAVPTAWPFAPAVPGTPSPRPTPSASVTPDCLRASGLCHWVYQNTHQAWLASSSYWVLVKPLRIALIIVVAILVRQLLHRAIGRLIRGGAAVPAVLRPLKERLPGSLQEVASIFPERRRQRAEAIGSVLRSFTTVVVYSVALLLILGELDVNIAPLLASAGIAGVALGFGAQSLVKDLIAGLFMLLEDQYGVGDAVDVGSASGTVESVGLRITTIRDANGVLWYIRNGEIVRVGNKSQGSAVVAVDIPVGYATMDRAVAVLEEAAAGLAEDETWHDDLIEPPQVVGVEQITAEGAVLRTTVKTAPEARLRVARELRRRLTEALAATGTYQGAATISEAPAPADPDPGAPAARHPETGPREAAADPGSEPGDGDESRAATAADHSGDTPPRPAADRSGDAPPKPAADRSGDAPPKPAAGAREPA